jgi:hypothetical protein
MLKDDFEWYKKNQEELLRQYDGKILTIKAQKVLGAYGSEIEALAETTKTHEQGTFIIQKCSPGDQDYTITFRSRVSFA